LIVALSIQNGIVVIPDYFAPGNKFSRFGYPILCSDNFLTSTDWRSGGNQFEPLLRINSDA